MDTNVNVNEVEAIVKKLDSFAEKCEQNYATKRDVEEMGALLKAYGAEKAKWDLKNTKHRVFGDMKTAMDFVDHLGVMVLNHPKVKGNDPMHLGRDMNFVTKTALDATTTTTGAFSVQTSVSDQISILITEYGKARQLHDVMMMTGNTDIMVMSDDAVATYSTNDTTNGSDTNQTFAKASLTPKQFLAIYRASGKLLYNSAIDVAGMIAQALARASGRLEDDTCWIGDGTSTYGSQTGYEDNTSVPVTSVASLAAVTIDNLIDLKYKASETSDGDGVYYISRKLRPVLKKIKGTSNDHYIFEVEGGNFEIDGTPVVNINRFHDGSTSGDMVCLYGNLRNAGHIGVNRDMAIDLDTSVDFVKAGLVWRLVEDFGFVVKQPTAVAKLRITATT